MLKKSDESSSVTVKNVKFLETFIILNLNSNTYLSFSELFIDKNHLPIT